MFISIIIPTLGRRATLTETLASLTRQTASPSEVIVVGVSADDLPVDVPGSLSVKLLVSEPGSTYQRNAGIRALSPLSECVVFLDDDVELAPNYLNAVTSVLGQDERISGCGGNVVADGARSSGIERTTALQLLREPQQTETTITDVTCLYGCNMTFRRSAIEGITFDERLPMYGWMEDADYSYSVSQRGRLVSIPWARLVHLGTKAGRTSGRAFGYSQIINPLYLCRKIGVPTFGKLLTDVWLKALLSNMVRSIASGARVHIDWRGRLVGNLIAFTDILRGRIRPERAAELAQRTSTARPKSKENNPVAIASESRER